MKYGFVLPVTDPRRVIELSGEAEAAGWDAIFIAEMLYGPDAWVTLAATAMKTSKLGLGTLLSPVARMRPWKIASEVATLDVISEGRTILAVGLGAPDVGYAEFREEIDRKTRIELTVETLDIMQKLWEGEPFVYQGKHYQIDTTTLKPELHEWDPNLVQKPRPPIWLTGAWPVDASMRRTLPYDGLLPNVFDENKNFRSLTFDDVRGMREFVERERTESGPFDIIVEGESVAGDSTDIEKVANWEAAGATWWIESSWSKQDDLDFLRARIVAGPPKS